MYSNTCKLCLFKCDPDDEGFDLCENIEELRKIVEEIFHSQVRKFFPLIDLNILLIWNRIYRSTSHSTRLGLCVVPAMTSYEVSTSIMCLSWKIRSDTKERSLAKII